MFNSGSIVCDQFFADAVSTNQGYVFDINEAKALFSANMKIWRTGLPLSEHYGALKNFWGKNIVKECVCLNNYFKDLLT